MNKVTSKVTIFFEEPFWVGVFEINYKGKLLVAKVTFGAEPKDYEIYDFIINHYYDLHFSHAIDGVVNEKRINPKRMHREVKRQLQNTGIGTKSQQALKLQQEQAKMESKSKRRKQKEVETERMFELKQQKRKDKHRGH